MSHLIKNFLLFAVLTMPFQTFADTIAVIGTGRVASALGPAFAELGHDIVYGSRDPSRESVRELVDRTEGSASAALPAESVTGADIVVLAVNWENLEEVVRGLGDLSGKIILDPTNAIGENADGSLKHALDYHTSASELVQSWAPNSMVVKAFNTLSSATMADPDTAGGPVSIPVVGNDEEAKRKVMELVEGIGLHPLDLGPLSNAEVVEGMLLLWFNARRDGTPFNYYFRPQP